MAGSQQVYLVFLILVRAVSQCIRFLIQVSIINTSASHAKPLLIVHDNTHFLDFQPDPDLRRPPPLTGMTDTYTIAKIYDHLYVCRYVIDQNCSFNDKDS